MCYNGCSTYPPDSFPISMTYLLDCYRIPNYDICRNQYLRYHLP
nr:MAG TPA: hypothetical protein [Caudoviricetes sp.]